MKLCSAFASPVSREACLYDALVDTAQSHAGY